MQDSRHQPKFGWIAIAYAAVIALVVYPALHEELGVFVFAPIFSLGLAMINIMSRPARRASKESTTFTQQNSKRSLAALGSRFHISCKKRDV
jgi:hypothetical protein